MRRRTPTKNDPQRNQGEEKNSNEERTATKSRRGKPEKTTTKLRKPPKKQPRTAEEVYKSTRLPPAIRVKRLTAYKRELPQSYTVLR